LDSIKTINKTNKFIKKNDDIFLDSPDIPNKSNIPNISKQVNSQKINSNKNHIISETIPLYKNTTNTTNTINTINTTKSINEDENLDLVMITENRKKTKNKLNF